MFQWCENSEWQYPEMQRNQIFKIQRENNFNPELNIRTNYQALGWNKDIFQIGKDAAVHLRKYLIMCSSKIKE